MDNSISKTNIIALALIYKYLATGDTSLKISEAEKFWLSINIDLPDKDRIYPYPKKFIMLQKTRNKSYSKRIY